MTECNLIIDSCCDLPAHVIDQEGVYLLKFPYVVGGETFEDDLFQTLSAQEFYEDMRKGAEPSTAQLTIPVLVEAFELAAQAGVPTVYLSFSSGLSGSYDVAVLVREQVVAAHPDFELYVVDTHLASVAEGLLVYEAINQRAKGLSASELAQWAQEARNFVNEEFMVDDLEALRRGGRIPASVAMAGSALDVKPLLNIDVDGKLALVGMARGRKKAIKQLVEYHQKNAAENGASQMVVIGHADCPKDAQRLKDALVKADENILPLECSIGPVIGSHVGPNMLAVVFWGRDKRENISVADRIAKRIKGGD